MQEKDKLGRRGFIYAASLWGLASTSACQALVGAEDAPTLTPTATDEPTKTPTKMPISTSTSEQSATQESTPDTRALLERYFYPALLEATLERRAQKKEEDSEYEKRIDAELNAGRVNFVFLGRRDLLTDSIQVMSLDLADSKIDTVTMHRDTQSPEVSGFLETEEPYRINQAYAYGGIPLIEKALESATGLSSDFVVVSEMRALPRMVTEVFGNKLEVVLPWGVPTNVKHYPEGAQIIGGDDALRLARERGYGSNRERNVVQQAILKGIFERVKKDMSSSAVEAGTLVAKASAFLLKEVVAGSMETNFDPEFFFSLASETVKQIAEEGFDAQTYGFGFPEYAEGYHIQAERVGYTYWLHRGILRPLDGDPAAPDLINGYWSSSRQEVKDFLGS